MASIELKNVTKIYEGFKALDALNLTVPSGSVYGLIGPNGAGKTTAIRHMMGVLRQDAGSVLLDGEPVFENPSVKARMLCIPDEPYFTSTSTTRDLMKFTRALYPRFDTERYEKLREIFALDDTRPIRRLSRGMQKQSAFWIALAARPEVLVLDEPVDGLDPVMRRQVWSLVMEDVAEEGMTVLVSSHNLRELEDVCDHVGIMQRGRCLLEKSVSELQETTTKVLLALPDGTALPEEGLDILHRSSTGKLQTLVGNFLDNGGVVELAAHAAGIISSPKLLFQGAIRRISHKRDHTGNLQRDDPSVEPALLGLGRHALADEVGQLPDDGRIGHMKRKGIRGRQRVLVELKAQLREAGGQFAVYLLVFVGKGRAAAGEPLVGLFEQSPLFGVQPQRLPPIVNRLDPGEQLRIEAYVIAELGQHGRKLQRESLHRIVRMRLVQVEENIGDAVQTTAAELERLDRIGECRGLGVADDRGDVGASLAHGLLESRLVMLVRDLRELRSSVGSRRLDEQRIDVRAGRAERQGCCHTTDY